MPTGRQIRAARTLVGWDCAELGRKVGLSRATIQNIELNIKRPRPTTLEKILRTFSDYGVEFNGDRGIELRDDTVRTISGKDCYAKLLDEICSQLQKDEEFSVAWADENLSPSVVHEAYRRIVKKGIRYKKLIKENNTTIYGPLDWYRCIPPDYYQNATAVFYQDKSAYLTLDWKKIIVLRDAALAKANKSFLQWVWSIAEIPSETTVTEPYQRE